MKSCFLETATPLAFAGTCLVVGTVGHAAEQKGAAPAPAAGLVNTWLRRELPAAAWDVGGQFRVPDEVKEDAG